MKNKTNTKATSKVFSCGKVYSTSVTSPIPFSIAWTVHLCNVTTVLLLKVCKIYSWQWQNWNTFWSVNYTKLHIFAQTLLATTKIILLLENRILSAWPTDYQRKHEWDKAVDMAVYSQTHKTETHLNEHQRVDLKLNYLTKTSWKVEIN